MDTDHRAPIHPERDPLVCKHCGFTEPAWKMFEPCGRCGLIYEPSPDEEPSSPVDVLRVVSNRWGWDPPYAVLVAAGGVFIAIAYCIEHYRLYSTTLAWSLRFWEMTTLAGLSVLLLVVKIVRDVVRHMKR